MAVEKAGLVLTVEQYNQFMQQVGDAGAATQQFGDQAQTAASQITSSFSGAGASFGEISNQLAKLSPDQLIAVNARVDELMATTGRALSGNDAYTQAFHEMGIGAEGAGKKIEATGKKTKDGGKEAEKATDSFIAFGAALTYVSAKATELVIQTTLVAGRIKELELLLEVTRQNAIALAEGEEDFTKAASLNAAAVEAQVQGIRDLHLSGIVANETVAQMIRYNLDWTKATELAAEAQDAATFAAQDSSQALEGLIKGITTLQPRILRTYGIMINLNEAYRTFADENNLASDELTQVQRQQAALNAVLAQAPSILGAYDASLESATKQIRSVRTDLINLAEAYGEFLEPAVAGAVSTFRGFLQTLTDFPAPARAFLSGLTTSGTALLTLTTGAATLLPILQKMKGGFSDLATAVGISGRAMAGFAIGIPAVIGVVSALIAAEKAHIAEASQVAASTDTYPAYVRALEIADEKSRTLTKQLWEQVQAQEAANQAAYAARILEEQRDMYTRLQQAVDRFGGSLDKAFEAWKAGAENLNEFQLAIMADEEALYNLAIRLGKTEEDARSWARTVSEWATVTVEAREEQEKLASAELPEYIEDATLKMTRLTTATDEYSRALRKIIDMPLPQQWDDWINPEDIADFLNSVNDAMDASVKSLQDANLRRNRALEDLDTEYHNKSLDAWIDYQRALKDTEGNLAAFHAGTLNELLDLDRDYLQDRNDAWTKYQQDLADAERDLQRDIEDANRKRVQNLSDLEAELAQDREDALRNLNEDLEEAARDHTENLLEIDESRQEALLDLQDEYGRRREAIEKATLDRMAQLEEDYQEKASDTRLKYARLAYEQSARDRPAHPSREYFVRLFKELELGSQIIPQEYAKLYKQMLKELEGLDQDLFWEQQDLTDDLEGEQETRLEDLEAWLAEEQAAIEAAYAEKISKENERFAAEQASRREDYEKKLEDLQRAHGREKAEIELNHQRRLADIRLQAEREREELARTYAQRLEDLEIEYNRERELVKTKLEEQNAAAREKYEDALEDLARAKKLERDEINLQYDRTIEDANAKLDEMVKDAGEKYGMLPEALRPTHRIMKDDLHNFLFGDSDSMANQWENLIDHIHKLLGIDSPSKVMMKIGENMMLGLEKGVGDQSIGDLLTGGFDAAALEANISAALPANMAAMPMGMGSSSVSNSTANNLTVNAQYAHQSEASLRDDLSLYNSMLGAWG